MRSVTSMKSSGRFDYPYFRALWNRVVLVLLAVTFLPVILIGGVFYHFTAQALKDKEIRTLELRALERKASIDSLLGDEIVRLQQVGVGLSFSGPGDSHAEQLKMAMDSLNERGGYIAGLAILDGNGRTIATAGPGIPVQESFSGTEALNRSIGQDLYVSELFRGSDGKTCFSIGVSGRSDDNRVLLAYIDASKFGGMPSAMQEQSGERFLVSREVAFQIGAPAGSQISHSPAEAFERFGGIQIQETKGALLLKVWQDRAPWLNVFKIAEDDAYRVIKRVRIAAGLIFFVLCFPIIGIILLIGNDLVSRLESKRGAIRTLDRQLRRTSYLSSSMELSLGCFREVKDTIFNVDSAIAVLREEPVFEESIWLRESVEQIHSEVQRARLAVDRFLRYIHPQPPLISDVDVHKLLDDLMGILDRELGFRNIIVRRSFVEKLPMLRSDSSKLRQVFQNIVLNALEAVERKGEIALITRLCEKGVAVSIIDNGPGISESDLDKIFEPLWTTRTQGTGLGLPICRDILDRLGGDITIESEVGKGTTVTIILPLRFQPFKPDAS
ncbi:MAG: ATP-binding protein [Syntrophobacteraceae bacterium]